MRRLVTLLVAVVGLAGCPKTSPPADPPPGGGGGSFDERQACTVDDDCVVVEVDCCDHCNGGTVVGIHRDHAAEVRRTYAGRDECLGATCTERGCVEQPTSFCAQGICGIRIGTQDTMPALPAL